MSTTEQTPAQTAAPKKKRSFSLLSNRAGAAFMAPAAALVGVFVLLPFFWVIFVSFTNRTLLGKTALNPEFVGL